MSEIPVLAANNSKYLAWTSGKKSFKKDKISFKKQLAGSWVLKFLHSKMLVSCREAS